MSKIQTGAPTCQVCAYFAVLCDRYAFRSKDVHASPLIFALSVACMIPDLPDCEVWLKEGPLAGLAHLFTLGTKPYHSVHCLPCVALQCTKRGPNASEGHDGRRLNQQNLYLLLITFAKCQPDTPLCHSARMSHCRRYHRHQPTPPLNL